MGKRKRLLTMIVREREFYDQCKVGSDEYVASQNRLKDLEKQVTELDDQNGRTAIEVAKVLVSVGVPVLGLARILAFEKDDSFSTSLRKYVDCFLPKRM